ncbi:hypothetical protein [Pseudomonas aeruginosa]|uniref:hypothetical protein n=1 Tax=Pseudomonas aeruginosa TaxID=287 RepID=UPI00071C1172|nr:hypothetical protein [Pseudomonas aeruginosa]KSR58682.1 hypothetical protein APB46_19615 [Pseudomonas aeruginosa]MBY9358225.1 hypothetical protein [Pseudomonas aeruginosa]MBY9465633.1 hypothetical protein [Pseudomonas aeruginosa]MBY9541855.1 hypothetical protein [Pseudomonas aeruginosa]MBY9555707.1 hypothetical protein [Pseudomonas aeruginosa]
MADALRPLAWATIYSHPGRKDIVEIGDADPVRERDAETWGWRHRRVQLVEIPAGHVVVPRELLERLYSSDTATALMAAAELRAILYP